MGDTRARGVGEVIKDQQKQINRLEAEVKRLREVERKYEEAKVKINIQVAKLCGVLAAMGVDTSEIEKALEE